MKNIKNTKTKYNIVSGLKILSILAFSVMLLPAIASADYGTNYNFGTFNGYNTNYNGNSVPPAPTPPAYIPAESTQTVYSTNTTNVVHTTATQNSTTSANNSGVTYVAVPAGSTIVNSVPAGATVVTPTVAPTTYGSLAANAVVGSSSGIFPSGLIQWVLLAIFILVIVILVRKIFGGKKRYYETPLKHA